MATETPILFLIFNRPKETFLVFESIRQANPKILFVAADGPRPDKQDENEKCTRAREVVQGVDWECEVKTLFREKNLGCKIAVSSAIDWAFSQASELIILEDDCLPDPSFFKFCRVLLERYRRDERVMMISGNNFQKGINRTEDSYYFSKYCHTWGWATWRRAWEYYDVAMRTWPEFRRKGLMRFAYDSIYEEKFWIDVFEATHRGLIDTWDFQWHYACRSQNGLAIIPGGNLVSNIGFGADATHTFGNGGWVANMPTQGISEVRHPSFVVRNLEADQYTFDHLLGGKEMKKRDSLVGTIRHALRSAMKKLNFAR